MDTKIAIDPKSSINQHLESISNPLDAQIIAVDIDDNDSIYENIADSKYNSLILIGI